MLLFHFHKMKCKLHAACKIKIQILSVLINSIGNGSLYFQVPGRLMLLALQSPIQTLDKAVNYAVFNNGQEERIVKVRGG